jgi:hypothetical protein
VLYLVAMSVVAGVIVTVAHLVMSFLRFLQRDDVNDVDE